MKGIYINDAIHGLIQLSSYEKQILSSAGFNRLHDVYQNSTVYLTFPSNRTKRFEHSIGTMKIASDMFCYSVQNASSSTLQHFYGNFDSIVTELVKESRQKDNPSIILNSSLADYSDLGFNKDDPFMVSVIPGNVPKKRQNLHCLLTEAIRIAALLHDIGHPPYSHVVEKSILDAYKSIINESPSTHTDREQYFIKEIKPFLDEDNSQAHENMGLRITEGIFNKIIKDLNSKNQDDQTEVMKYMILRECTLAIMKDQDGFSDLHRIISSPLDADRLDYVTRDPLNSGFNAGKIDYDRILPDMKLMENEGVFLFCPSIKAINAVEDFLRRRFNLYKDIICHHRVVKTDYLLGTSVRNLIFEYLKENKAVDKSETMIKFDISGLWFPFGKQTANEVHTSLAQWNDSWLMSTLKHIYYSDYYNKRSTRKKLKQDSQHDIISKQLSELIENKKQYSALIKRREDFDVIDFEIKAIMKRKRASVHRGIDRLTELSKKADPSESQKYSQGIVADQSGSLDSIMSLIDEDYQSAPIYPRVQSFPDETFSKIDEKTEEIICKNLTNFSDTLVVFKKIRTGIGPEGPYFYNKNKLLALADVSNIGAILREESLSCTPFYVYVLDFKGGDLEKKSILKRIGREIGEFVIETINEVIKKQMEDLKNV